LGTTENIGLRFFLFCLDAFFDWFSPITEAEFVDIDVVGEEKKTPQRLVKRLDTLSVLAQPKRRACFI
jgi:hypothetical protein